MFKHILIPTDGSPLAEKAINAGVSLAKEMGARVTAFYAIEPPPTHLYGEGYLAERNLVQELERRARANAQSAVDEVVAAAKAAGYRALYGQILHANHAMLELAAHLGFEAQAAEGGDVTVVRQL